MCARVSLFGSLSSFPSTIQARSSGGQRAGSAVLPRASRHGSAALSAVVRRMVKSPPESILLGTGHVQLVLFHQVAGFSHRILPCTGIIAPAETAAKLRHEADDVVHRNDTALALEAGEAFVGKGVGKIAPHADDEHAVA